MSKVYLSAESQAKTVIEEIEATEYLKEISKNISIDNLKLLAEKSKLKDINKKIQKYKYFL